MVRKPPPELITLDPAVNGFERYISQQISRMALLAGLLENTVLPAVQPGICNTRLEAAGRADLAIAQPAPMRALTDPAKILTATNNFPGRFAMYTAINGDFRNGRVPVTAAQLQELTGGGQPDILGLTHAKTPAFHRMLVLLPEFTTDLVTGISQEGRPVPEQFQLELFVGYQAMSRLVDRQDPSVTAPDGAVREGYLFGY